MKRTIVIGDLHGIYDETVDLLDRVQATSADRVIFLGDLVDRGPENAKCVDLVMQIEKSQGQVACVLGNHEAKHLEYEDIRDRKGHVNVVIPTHVATRRQLTPEHYAYFRTLPLYVKLPEFNAVVVHAGVWPGRRIEQQTQRHLTHIQSINPSLKNDEKSMWPSRCAHMPGWKFWTNFWTGPERIIFGHSVLDRPLVTEHAVGIDGGGVFGRSLHALVLPDWKIVTVSCSNDHGAGRRGRSSEDIAKFHVGNDVYTFS